MSALWYRWAAVTKMGPIGSITSFEPWTHWIRGFYKWDMDAFPILNELASKVVGSRQTPRLQAWSKWIREDLSSHPYQRLRPDLLFLLLTISFASPRILPLGLGCGFTRLSSVPIFVKHGCRGFAGKGTQWFLDVVGDHLPQDVAMAKKIHRWWIGLPWNEVNKSWLQFHGNSKLLGNGPRASFDA